jgi:hypothetical protein
MGEVLADLTSTHEEYGEFDTLVKQLVDCNKIIAVMKGRIVDVAGVEKLILEQKKEATELDRLQNENDDKAEALITDARILFGY